MNLVILDLPIPLEPVAVDLDEPLEGQLFGVYLDAARRMLCPSSPEQAIDEGTW